MTTENLLWVIFGAVIALAVTTFMYFFDSKRKDKKRWWFAILRFLTLFAGTLLLVNPKFKSVTYEVERQSLVVAIDNSASIKELKQDAAQKRLVDDLFNDKDIAERFQLRKHIFDRTLLQDTSISHIGAQTNIQRSLNALAGIYKQSPILLLSDGNQTFGSDYSYVSPSEGSPVFPLVLGDSIQPVDVAISRLNANRYAFLKNSFPVELIVNYNGHTAQRSRLVVKNGNTTVYSKDLLFSPTQNSTIVEAQIQANRAGLQRLSATVLPLQNEKNVENNTRYFAVEVVDQQTKVALISDISHPDLGAFKEAIESNEQRQVSIMEPTSKSAEMAEYDVVMLYQPNSTFKTLIGELKRTKQNVFIISGPNTDLSFLNRNQPFFEQRYTGQTDNALPVLSKTFNSFLVADIGFDQLPPLRSEFGDLRIEVTNDVLLYKSINGITTKDPLLVTFEEQDQRGVLLFGEGIWRWRMQSFVDKGDFQEFDAFIGKLIQYASSSTKKARLSIDHKTFYYGSNDVTISAQFFDKNFVFNPNTKLDVTIVNKETHERLQFPMLLKNNQFVADLSSLSAGSYRFTVRPENENISRSGNFEVIPFDIERQFLSADVTKLKQLATNTGGSMFFPAEIDTLKTLLMTDDRFTPIQKASENIVPLIAWRWLLAIMALSLAIEWFLRKYNGLI